MADDKTDDDAVVKFGELKSVVEEVVKDAIDKLTGNGDKKADTSDPSQKINPATISQEVREALAEIHKGDTEQQQRESAESRLKAVEEKVAEKAPVERSRKHRIMGWGD